ncbi:MAG: ribonuclease H-like domain-containing protein [Chloroflexota bacterium]
MSQLVLDLETQRLAHEVGGWSFVDRLGLAVAVTLDVASGEVRRFTEAEAPLLLEHLRQAPSIIGYNLLRFDYPVLRPYGFQPEGIVTIDLLDHLYRQLGFHVSLDNVAGATLGDQKTADGVQAVSWFRQGQIEKVFEYCEADVRVTYRLWEHGRLKRWVRFRDRDFRLREVQVAW